MIAELIRDELHLDKVLFIPVGTHAIKNNASITPAHHRLAMLQIALSTNDHFELSDIELNSESISYTVDTVRNLKTDPVNKNTDFFFLTGIDNINTFHLWKEPETLLGLCRFIAFGRPGYKPVSDETPFRERFQEVEIPLLEISSSQVRKRISEGKTIRYLVQRGVERYIRKNGLYR